MLCAGRKPLPSTGRRLLHHSWQGAAPGSGRHAQMARLQGCLAQCHQPSHRLSSARLPCCSGLGWQMAWLPDHHGIHQAWMTGPVAVGAAFWHDARASAASLVAGLRPCTAKVSISCQVRPNEQSCMKWSIRLCDVQLVPCSMLMAKRLHHLGRCCARHPSIHFLAALRSGQSE